MKIVKIYKGTTSVIEEGTRKQLTNRLKQLRSSTRNGTSGRGGKKYKVEYKIEE